MFVPNFRRCPLALKLMSFVLNVSKSCTLCSLRQTQLNFFLLNLVTQGILVFVPIFNIIIIKKILLLLLLLFIYI
ncbi:hypothetical protein Hanom_Chr10g00920171 [Helianthus anomalus]